VKNIRNNALRFPKMFTGTNIKTMQAEWQTMTKWATSVFDLDFR